MPPTLGVDAGRIAVGGDSAGGMLAAIVTQMAREKGGLKIAYQLLLFPNTQMGGETSSLNEFAVGYFLERRAIEYFNSLYLPPDADTQFAQSLAAARQGFRRPAAGLCDAGRL